MVRRAARLELWSLLGASTNHADPERREQQNKYHPLSPLPSCGLLPLLPIGSTTRWKLQSKEAYDGCKGSGTRRGKQKDLAPLGQGWQGGVAEPRNGGGGCKPVLFTLERSRRMTSFSFSNTHMLSITSRPLPMLFSLPGTPFLPETSPD